MICVSRSFSSFNFAKRIMVQGQLSLHLTWNRSIYFHTLRTSDMTRNQLRDDEMREAKLTISTRTG